ncbi:MAG: XrtA system polysaccharide chain length determinant [Thermodesulfobacteriota bacterium]
MTDKENKIDFTYYLDMLRRRKWYVIPTFFLIIVAGLVYCLTAPKIYKSSTTISIVRQRVPESFVHSTVTADIDERIHSIGQEILSRTRLEGVINQLNLYPDQRKDLPMEKIIEMMRNNISIELSSARRGATAFTLGFEDGSPQTAALVANTLASMFMEEHLKLREEHARGTSEFLAEQLQQVEAQLRKRESEIGRYKMAHIGELPTQSQANLSVLTGLQQQLEAVQEGIRRAKESKVLIHQQMQMSGTSGTNDLLGILEDESSEGASDPSLQQLKELLAALETKYTANHPDVLKTKKMIEKIEKKLAAKSSDTSVKESGGKTGGNPILESFQGQMAGIDVEIKNLEAEAAQLKKKIFTYQGRIENMPRREQELFDLQRDYENLSASYQSLLAKKLEAERAESLERRQKGEQFRILDPARVPQMPSKPNIPRMLAMTIMAALGISVGLAFGREYIDKSFYRIEDIESFLKLPVLTSIPLLVTADNIKVNRKHRLIAISAISLGIVVTSVLLFAVIKKYPGVWI